MMKKIMLSSHLPCGIVFTLAALATGFSYDEATSSRKITPGTIDGNPTARILPAEAKSRKTSAAKTTRLRLAQVHYLLLVLSLGAAVGFLTFLLLQVIGNTVTLH